MSRCDSTGKGETVSVREKERLCGSTGKGETVAVHIQPVLPHTYTDPGTEMSTSLLLGVVHNG